MPINDYYIHEYQKTNVHAQTLLINGNLNVHHWMGWKKQNIAYLNFSLIPHSDYSLSMQCSFHPFRRSPVNLQIHSTIRNFKETTSLWSSWWENIYHKHKYFQVAQMFQMKITVTISVASSNYLDRDRPETKYIFHINHHLTLKLQDH